MKENEKITKRSFLKKLAAFGGMLFVPRTGMNGLRVIGGLADVKESELPPMPIVQLGNVQIYTSDRKVLLWI